MKRIIQISDTHVFGNPDERLLGHDSNNSLKKIVDMIIAKNERPDIILLTGDMIQSETTQSYQVLEQILKPLAAPIYTLYGNHDAPALFPKTTTLHQDKFLILDSWTIILLNSQIIGEVHGHLSDTELQFLNESLKANIKQHCIIALHHQPTDIGSPWLDRIGLRNQQPFHQILNQYSNVKAVIWGHVHQAFDSVINNVAFLSCPSTCIQFKPNTEQFALDLESNPGYRSFKLNADGSLISTINRLKQFEYIVDVSAKGY